MSPAAFETGFSVRPADGFAGAGDAVVARECGDRLILAVIDVLGHGPTAHDVAVMIESLLEQTSVTEPGAILSLLHTELSGRVGAAAGITTVQRECGRARFAGIGNTVARVFGAAERRLTSVDGVLGQRPRNPRPIDFTLGPGDVLVMHSDGISSRFRPEDYPMLRTDEPTVAAREVVRRFGKTHDDAACLVARRTA